MRPATSMTLFSSPGTGSAIVEAALVLAGLDFDLVDVDYTTDGPRHPRLLAANPLAQLPTLLLADGTVMTESAAILLYLHDLAPAAGLVPPVGSADRPRFLRFLVYLVANIYPTFTIGDFPERWVDGKAAQEQLLAAIMERRRTLWRWLEAEALARPWFFGESFSALDLYVAAMTRWRPRRPWFQERCPRLHSIAIAADGIPELAGVWSRNFPSQSPG